MTGPFRFRSGLVEYISNLWTMFLSPRHGFLLLSPIILVAAIGAVWARRQIPHWATVGALSGLGYLLVHAAFNRASGGMELFYRYPLEALALASVALSIGALKVYRSGGAGKIIVLTAAISSVTIQVFNVFYLSCYLSSPNIPACLAF